jgi:hypothetical protein
MWAMLMLTLGVSLPSAAPSAGIEDETTNVVHFALIRPDPANDETALTPDAAWIHRPKNAIRKSDNSASRKKNKNIARGVKKPEATVTPLRRERPKSETDPPKTRRRELGW